MTELYDEFFAMLRFTKNLCDYGMAERVKDWFGSYQLDGDNYWELAYEAIGWIFRDTRHYFNDNEEIETWMFTDPVIDRFCKLCQEYETRRGISEEENPYRKEMERTLHDGLTFGSYDYDYDWQLSSQGHGRKCLLLFTGCEFYSHDEVPEGLLEIRDGFQSMIAKLEMSLSRETNIIPLVPAEEMQRKEAA